jgi:hypothetical protein
LPFFEAAFNSSTKEGETQTMTLEDVESGVFGLLVNWLYTQKAEDAEEPYVKVEKLAKLWIFAQRCIMPTLRNDALTRIPETLACYVEMRITDTEDTNEWYPAPLGATIFEDINAWTQLYTQ